jgi:hypothetical protein
MPMEAAKILGTSEGADTQLRVEFKIGGQSNKSQADREAKEFMDPRVFTRRSAIFPNPQNFGIKLFIESARAYRWPNPPSPLNQFYVQLALQVTGPDAQRIAAWVRRVEQAIMVYMPTAYGSTGDRAKHLAETGKHNPVTQGVASPGRTYTGHGGDREAHLRERGIDQQTKEGAKRQSIADVKGEEG